MKKFEKEKKSEKRVLFDTHAHYDHRRFHGEGPKIVRELYDAGIINGVVIPAISYESNFNRLLFPEEEFPYVYFASGVHPRFSLSKAKWTDAKKQAFHKLLLDPRTVAVKSGLDLGDYSLSEDIKKSQRECLGYMMDLSVQFKLPLILHIRDAADEVIRFLKEKPSEVEIEVHCFTYDYRTAFKMMEVGITRFGIGGMLTRDGKDLLRDCVRRLPLSTILLETDAPFVKPKDFRGTVNTSEILWEIVQLIAELKGISTYTVADTVQKNAYEFFGI